jgi:arylformamidase
MVLTINKRKNRGDCASNHFMKILVVITVICALFHAIPMPLSALESGRVKPEDNGITPLMKSIESGDLISAGQLIKKGAAVNERDDHGATPLYYALGAVESAVFLLDHGADVNATDNMGRSALMYAAMSGKENVVKVLLARGADAHVTDRNGDTALHGRFFTISNEIKKMLAATGQQGKGLDSGKRNSQDASGSTGHIKKVLDIPYLPDVNPAHRLDLYFPAQRDSLAPVLIHFHGGGWEKFDKRDTEPHGIFYASKGIIFVSVNFRPSSAKIHHPAHIEDCAAAVAWVYANLDRLGGDPKRVFLSGFSSGAHLASLLAVDPSYLLKHQINPKMIAGVISVDTACFDLAADDNEEMVKYFIKRAFGTDPAILKSASPIYHISDGSVYPSFLVLASQQRPSIVNQSVVFVDKLQRVKDKARCIVVENHKHTDMDNGMYYEADPVGRAILNFILSEI